jgi:hypothetical protein
MEELNEVGEWWLPSQPDRKVGGRLTFSVDDGARLSLIGSLRDWLEEGREVAPGHIEFGEDDLTAAGNYGRLHGQVGASAYTLDGCFRVRVSRNLFGGLATEEIHADQIYRGAWYEPDEVVVANRLSVRLLHLPYWMPPSRIQAEWSDRTSDTDPGYPIVTVAAQPVSNETLTLVDDATLTILQTVGTEGDGIVRRSITQDFAVQIETPDRRGCQDLMALMRDVQDVVSIGLNRTACIEAATFYDPELARDDGDRRREIPLGFLAQWSDREGWREPQVLTEYDRLFSFTDIGAADGLAKLLRTASRYRSELRRVTATRNGRSMFTSDRLVNRAAAIESFDRALTGASSSRFRTRIKRCTTLAGEPFEHLVGDLTAWVDLFKTRRDLHAHHLERAPDEGGFLDLIMADCAYFLFVLCLLRDADAPPQVFELIKQNRDYEWLAKQVPAVLAKPS